MTLVTAPPIHVVVFPAFRRRVTQRRLRAVARAALDAAGAGAQPGELGVVIADDAALQDLNARHRGEPSVTDVLAFSPRHAGPYMGDDEPHDAAVSPFPAALEGPEELGEVVISYPQARRQAREARRPVAQEVDMLVAHGVLHLLGYDHALPEEARAMFALQDAALALAGTDGRGTAAHARERG